MGELPLFHDIADDVETMCGRATYGGNATITSQERHNFQTVWNFLSSLEG